MCCQRSQPNLELHVTSHVYANLRGLLEKEEYYASVLERQAGKLAPLPWSKCPFLSKKGLLELKNFTYCRMVWVGTVKGTSRHDTHQNTGVSRTTSQLRKQEEHVSYGLQLYLVLVLTFQLSPALTVGLFEGLQSLDHQSDIIQDWSRV